MKLLSADATMFLKLNKKKFAPENMKKRLHNRPNFFFLEMARLPKRPKNRNPVPPKAL